MKGQLFFTALFIQWFAGFVLFLPEGQAIEGKEYKPDFVNPPLIDFDINPPQSYLQDKTRELFRLLEEPPQIQDTPIPWYAALKMTYGGIGHNHFQTFLMGHKKRNTITSLIDIHNEYDFSLKNVKNFELSSSHNIAPEFYMQVDARANWVNRPMPDENDPFPHFSTSGSQQNLSVHTRELNQNHIVYSWLGVNHCNYNDQIHETNWHNWQLAFYRAYQFAIIDKYPMLLKFAFSGDRLSNAEESFLRTWNEVVFSSSANAPFRTKLKLETKFTGFSAYDGLFKVRLIPTLEIAKRFSSRVSTRFIARSYRHQPSFNELYYNKNAGSVHLVYDNVRDGEIYDPLCLQQHLTFRLSPDEAFNFHLEQRFRKSFYYWEDRDQDINPEVYFAHKDIFIFRAGLAIDTKYTAKLHQIIGFDFEKQFHHQEIFPNVSDLYLKGQFGFKYDNLSLLKINLAYNGDFYSDSLSTIELSGSFRLDLLFQQYISKNFSFLVEGINITDTNSYNEYGLNEKNRRYRFGVLILK